MKLIFITICVCLIGITAAAQTPTLSAGLDALTLNKGTIDVKVLTQIIVDKQKELKQEALKRFILKLFPETNYTTKFYIQNCLNTLFNEKNPQVIEKQILELTTNYALALGVAKVYANTADRLAEIQSAYDIYKKHSLKYRNELIASYQDYKQNEEYFKDLNDSLKKKNEKISKLIEEIDGKKPIEIKDKYESLDSLEKLRKGIEKHINRIKIRNDVVEPSAEKSLKTTIPFDVLVDVVSSALSEIPALKKLGFFKEPIDYRNDTFYINLGTNGADSSDIKFQAALKVLRKKVQNEITPYITNYDIIKEFCLSKKDEQAVSIQKDLIAKYATQIKENVGLNRLIEIVSSVADTSENKSKLANKFEDNTKNINQSEKSQKWVTQYTIKLGLLSDYKTLYDNIGSQIMSIKNHYNFYEKNDTTLKAINQIDTTKVEIMANGHFKEICDLKKKFDAATISLDSAKNTFEKQANDIAVIKDTAFVVLSAIDFKPIDKAADNIANAKRLLDSITSVIKNNLADATINIVETGDFFDLYLKGIVKKFAGVNNLKITTKITNINAADFDNYTSLMAKTYQLINQFLTKNATLKDIQYIDNEVIPQLIKYSVTFNAADTVVLKGRIEDFKLLSELLKINAVSGIKGLDKYEPALVDLFAFIKNLDNLDQAETYQTMLNLLQDANTIVEQNLEDGKFKNIYILFSNAIKKYTLINTDKQYVQVDVVSFLTDLQQYFDKNNSNVLGLYLTLGLNQNSFFSDQILPGATDHTKYIGFASEKIGLKIRFNSFNRVRGYENAIKSDVNLNKKAPFINEWYGIVYGSGLLYSIANTSTSNKFTYPHIGFGTGLRFYNSLDVNFVVGFPFVKDEPLKKYAFWGIGFDIPLGEYLEKIGGNKQ